MTYSTFRLMALIITIFSTQLLAQTVEIQGEAKVTNMSNDNSIDEIVVRKADGTLATRTAQSLPISFADTTRNISSDIELAKLLCECPNPPSFLIKQLLDSGYDAKDLQAAGVPLADIALNIPIKDIDGNEYDQVKIGSQIWLASNLKVTQFNDGTDIDLVEDNDLWDDAYNDEVPAYCYPNGDNYNEDAYGLIYNLYTIELYANKNICPIGFHIPVYDEINTLITILDSDGNTASNTAGSHLKEVGLDYWASYNNDANNITGFTARANGYRYANHSNNYVLFNATGNFLSNQNNGASAHFIGVLSDNDGSLRLSATFNNYAATGIRCLKD